MSKTKILFISHDASRTGAPTSLLHIIKYLKSKLDLEVTTLFKVDGPLSMEFRKEGEVLIWPTHVPTPFHRRVINRILKSHQRKQHNFIDKIKRSNYDLIYANTAATSDLVALFEDKQIPCFMHVHELNVIIKSFCGEEAFNKASKKIDRFFAVSGLVEKMLINDFIIPKNKITKVYEPVPYDRSFSIENKNQNDSFTVVGCGTLDWRKGPDIFLTIARQLFLTAPDSKINFIWVGGNLHSHDYLVLENDIRLAQLQNKVSFTGEMSNPVDVFKQARCFLLTSREDPFPLVCLENANVGNPIICFKQTTGMSEVINENNGFCADYLDIGAVVAELLKMSTDYAYYNNKSENIRLLAEKFSPDIVVRPILNEISRVLN